MIRFFTLVFLVCIGTAGQAQSDTFMVMSLQECIDYALIHNADAINAELDIKISKRKQGEYLSAGLPQVAASIKTEYNFEVPTVIIPSEVFGGVPGEFTPVKFSTAYIGNVGITFEQMVFVGSFFVGLEASRAATSLYRKRKIKSEQDLIELISKAYYLCLVNNERARLVERTFLRIDSLLHDTEIMYEAGVVENIDVDRVKVQYNNAKVEKENFQSGLDLSYAILKFHMGMSFDSPLNLKDPIQDTGFDTLLSHSEKDFKPENRIEYLILQSQSDLVRLDIKNSVSKYFPAIYIYGNYGANAGTNSISNLFDFKKQWFTSGAVGLRLNMPIFLGLNRKRIIQQKRLESRKVENTMNRLQRSIDLDIQRTNAALRKGIDKLAAQQENMKLAERVYRVSKIKYESGVGSNMEVINADVSFMEAQNNYYTALYDVLIAKVDLKKAYGELTQNDNK